MAKPQNWIIFLSDNHAHSAVGYHDGSIVKTPALDSLAKNGTVFENAYCASPLCCPSRASIATGQFPHQTGFSDNAIVYDGSVESWMHRARETGHEVVSVGKLHYQSGEEDNGFSEERLPMHILNGRGGTSMLLRAREEGERENIGQWELYHDDIGTGGSSYQQFDRDITRSAIEWLRDKKENPSDKPWILLVSYVSAHPPFKVPQHLLDLYNREDMPLPVAHSAADRNPHPAAEHLRQIMRTQDLEDTDNLRRIAHHYYALVSHLDAQIGDVMGEVAALEMTDLRYMYTSDHGEMLGDQGILGKFCGYEGSLKVPMIISGDGIEKGKTDSTPVSAVDIFPTVLDGLGLSDLAAGPDGHGVSILQDIPEGRDVFAEYHATATKHGTFVLRSGYMKLLYHVGMSPELFDLSVDPRECKNLADDPSHKPLLNQMIAKLKVFCDPEDVDAEIRAAQLSKIEDLGGVESIYADGAIVFSPTPGQKAELREIK